MMLRIATALVVVLFLTVPSRAVSGDEPTKKVTKTDHACCMEKADGKDSTDCKDMAMSKDNKACSDAEKMAMKSEGAGKMKMDCCSEHKKSGDKKTKETEIKDKDKK